MKILKLISTLIFSVLLFFAGLNAQVRISGMVVDAESGESLISAAVVLVDMPGVGTVTNVEGAFTLKTAHELPFTLRCSYLGYQDAEVEITSDGQEVEFRMIPAAFELGSVVVEGVGDRKWEEFVETGVPIQRLGLRQIKAASTADFYDEIAKLPGVHSNQGSFTFNTINTRGFATANNTRFVQLVDGIDNSAPILNFPLGNLVGISELDVRSVDLIPGTASALYGPNAFNGLLQMTSKSPFEFEGLSAQVKFGFMNADNLPDGNQGFSNMAIRYAQKVNDRFAFKVNFSYMFAEDWVADDYTTDRNLLRRQAMGENVDPQANVEGVDFDGMNIYGDETSIPIFFNDPGTADPLVDEIVMVFEGMGIPEAFSRPFLEANVPLLQPIQFNRRGFEEGVLLSNREVGSIKGDVALHYKLTPDLEASYNYRYGQGSGMYHGGERFFLDGFTMQNHKVELLGKNFNARAYMTLTDEGDSYNLTALGSFINEAFSPTAQQWAPEYAGTYAGTIMGAYFQAWNESGMTLDFNDFINDDIRSLAHQQARFFADRNIPDIDSPRFQDALEGVLGETFNKGGAGFEDNSRVYHAELNYDFSSALDNVVELLVGGNWRQYDLFSNGTILNEDPDGDGVADRIQINEFGGYLQASKKLLDDHLKVTGSVRYDKNENFEGQFSPRVSLQLAPDKERNHVFRLAYQTGFRNPAVQEQYLYFPAAYINVGGTKDNAERYGIYEGGAWSFNSFLEYQQCLLAGGDPGACAEGLITQELNYVQPEKLQVYEIGYRSRLLDRRLSVDLTAYYNNYEDFIVEALAVSKEATEHQGRTLPAGTIWSAFTNADQEVTSYGVTLGLNYKLNNAINLFGNYGYAKLEELEDENFISRFNTPENRFTLGLSGRKVWKGLGFGLSYRWQDEMFYESTFGTGNVPSFGSMDAQLSWFIDQANMELKIGGTNLIGDDFQTIIGGPMIGKTFFLGVTYNNL
jgi:iron complex outermembrane receptor protein